MYATFQSPRARLAPLLVCAALPGCWSDGSDSSPATTAAPAPSSYHLGGSVGGLTATGLVLANGAATVSPAANATTFTFPTTLAGGTSYSVSVQTQPAGLKCSVAGGAGTIASADVTSVAVTCSAASYRLGGTLSGLTAAGLVLANGSDTVSPASGATTFTLPTALLSGAAYDVTVQTQPTGLACTVASATGTVSTADVSSVSVTCATAASSGFSPLAGTAICPAGNVDQNGTGSAAVLPYPASVVIDASGDVYTMGNGVIDKITSAGVVTTFAGQYQLNGDINGPGAAATFGNGQFLGGIDAAGNVYVSESASMRRVTPAGVVSTLAGPTDGTQGYVDGTGSAARFSQWGLGVTADGTSYVADYANHVVRKVTSTGVTTTFAGQRSQPGDVDGVGAGAQLLSPQYAIVDGQGTVYVSDQNLTQVRKITADGTVTTLAGTAVNGWKDGPGSSAQFYGIRGLALGPAGSIYVLDQPNLNNGGTSYSAFNAIRKITPDGMVSTVVKSSYGGTYFSDLSASNPLVISQSISSMGSAPDGTLWVTSTCAVGSISLP